MNNPRSPMATPSYVAIVYHYFPHYREAVMRELSNNGQRKYLLVGDRVDPNHAGVKPMDTASLNNFIFTPCWARKESFLFQWGLVRLVLRRDIDSFIFLGCFAYVSTWIAAIVARLLGKRVLFWTIGWMYPEKGIKNWVRRTFYRLANGLLLYGEHARTIALQNGFKAEDLYVVYNSMDYEAQRSLREKITRRDIIETRENLFPGSHRPMLICTTRLIHVRRLDWALEAVALLKSRGHDVDILFVGEGPEKENLKNYAEKHGLSVKFYGECYDENVLARLIMSANAMLVPGQVGLVAMHGLAFGTPILTHGDRYKHSSEWEAITPGVSGEFFQRGNVEDMARVIERWTRQELPDESVRAQCHEIMDRLYNPQYQCRVIERALAGEPADALA